MDLWEARPKFNPSDLWEARPNFNPSFLLLLCCICCDVKRHVFRVSAISVDFNVVVTMHARQDGGTISIDIAVCPLWAPITVCIHIVVLAQWPWRSSLAC